MSESTGSEVEEQLHEPARSLHAMEADLRVLLAGIEEPHLALLLRRVFGDASSLWARYRVAPAAKRYHQAYRHGLLEHSLTVAEAVGAVAATFPEVDRDVAVTGALLHDIGKLEAYADDAAAIDLTDVGRLQGEIVLGYYIVRREIEQIEGFPQELAWQVLHIVLSHHGSLEHGSPVVPCTREATLVHMIDNLGGRLGSFDRVQREMHPGQRWATFDRALRASAYFARGQQAPEDTQAEQRQAA
jgi:3'-5' exoribonuclease